MKEQGRPVNEILAEIIPKDARSFGTAVAIFGEHKGTVSPEDASMFIKAIKKGDEKFTGGGNTVGVAISNLEGQIR